MHIYIYMYIYIYISLFIYIYIYIIYKKSPLSVIWLQVHIIWKYKVTRHSKLLVIQSMMDINENLPQLFTNLLTKNLELLLTEEQETYRINS